MKDLLKLLINELKMFNSLEYLENALDVISSAFFADLSLRSIRACYEYFIHGKYYLPNGKFLKILQRAFSYTEIAKIYIIIVISIMIARTYATKRILPPLSFFTYSLPIYWLWFICKVPHSTLDYACWLRGDHNLDYAKGMASSYFHGYLNLTLPSYKGHQGLHQRIELYENTQRVEFAMNRLLILIPNKMYIKPKFESSILERVQPLETVMKDRAGVFRPFKNDVYRFTVPIGPHNRIYYISVEGATPLLSFYEAVNSNLTSSWQMQEMQREILLEFYRYLKRLCTTSPDIEQEVEIVFYDAYDSNKQPVDIGVVLRAHLENLWHEGRLK